VGRRAKAPTSKHTWGLKFIITLIFTTAVSEESFLILHLTQKFEVKRKYFLSMKPSRFLLGRILPHIIHSYFQSAANIKRTAFYLFRFKPINTPSHVPFF